MHINTSGATFSSIVGIGENLKALSKKSGKEYLYLNRGINAVTNIDLRETVNQIDFNSSAIQTYPPNRGIPELRELINEQYLEGKSHPDNIFITPGGMPALDLVTRTLSIKKLFYRKFYWGSYAKMAKINGVETTTYEDENIFVTQVQHGLIDPQLVRQSAILICDPNNPVGDKMDDEVLLRHLKILNDAGMTIIFDSPYRLLFFDQDNFFERLLAFENLIITESFSKSVGLSGQRLGFVHSLNQQFNNEFNVRLLYLANGVNAFAQYLVYLLLSAEAGRQAVSIFRDVTRKGIAKNIHYLQENKMLYENVYRINKPIGIFVVLNRTEEELLQYRIGCVSMKYFTTTDHHEEMKNYARICVSVPHEKFVEFFEPMIV